MRSKIQGEESATFTNTLGDSITVEILGTPTETAFRLEKVLNGDKIAANLLAEEIHRVTNGKSLELVDPIPDIDEPINLDNLGIWIDPIDGTAEYIKGIKTTTKIPTIPASGLECVTILIGVYDNITGLPIIGVINQPFFDGLKSKIYWGVAVGETKVNNIIDLSSPSSQQPSLLLLQQQPPPPRVLVEGEEAEEEEEKEKDESDDDDDDEKEKIPERKIAIASFSENKKIIEILEKMGYDIIYSSGAGHKILKLITGDVDLYLLSKSTSFKWDTCGPHAILLSQNHHLVNFVKSLDLLTSTEVTYRSDENTCNEGGVLAYKKDTDFELLKELEMAYYSVKVFVD